MISLLSVLPCTSNVAIVIAIIVVVVTFIYTKKNWIMGLFSKKVIKDNMITNTNTNTNTNTDPNTDPNQIFAVNDNGNFDLADATGKILNIGFGPNQKVYINLLDQAEKDVDKSENGFTKKVDTKVYEIGGRPYTVNFTKLAGV
jgi:hypothetical protein